MSKSIMNHLIKVLIIVPLFILTSCGEGASSGSGEAGSNNTATNNTETANNSSAQIASTSGTTRYTPTFSNVNVGITTSQDNKASTLYYGNTPFATNPLGVGYTAVLNNQDTWVTSTELIDGQIISSTGQGIRYGNALPFMYNVTISSAFTWNSLYINPAAFTSSSVNGMLSSTTYTNLISPFASSTWLTNSPSESPVIINNLYIVAANSDTGSIAILNSNDTNSQTIGAAWNVFAASSGNAYFNSSYPVSPLAVYTVSESPSNSKTDYVYTTAISGYPQVEHIVCPKNNGSQSSTLSVCDVSGLPSSSKYAITALTVSNNLLYALYQDGELYVGNLSSNPTSIKFQRIKNSGSYDVFATCPISKNPNYPFKGSLVSTNVMLPANFYYQGSTSSGIFLCGKNLNGSTHKNKNEVYSILPTDSAQTKFAMALA